MNHPLDGITLKIIRAKEHLDMVVAEIARHKQNCRIAQEQDSDTNRIKLIAEFCDPPLMLSVIVGDCLHNLRSALDHLIWQLALVDPLGKPTLRNQFPICRDTAAWDREIKGRRLEGIPHAAKAFIEELQPYHFNPYTLHPLWWLDHLINIDKHRTMAFTFVTTQNWLGDIVYPVNDSDTVICSVATAKVEKVKMQLQGGLSIAFKELPTPNRFDAGEVMKMIFEYVGNNVIPTFKKFFN